MDAVHLYSYGKFPFTLVFPVCRNPSSTSEQAALKFCISSHHSIFLGNSEKTLSLPYCFLMWLAVLTDSFFVVSFVHFEVTCISKSTEHPFSLQIMELFNRIREVCYGVRPGESCDRGSKTSILTAHCHSFFYIGVNPSLIKGNSKY